MREMMEMGAGVGLVLGVALGAVLLFTAVQPMRVSEGQLILYAAAFTVVGALVALLAGALVEAFRGRGPAGSHPG